MINVEKIFANAIDRTISVISPRRALIRRMDRERLELVGKRMETYAAAKTTRLTGPWTVGSSNVNDIIGASSPILRARTRQLIRDFPYLARAVKIMVDFSIGTGIVFQSKVETASGKRDKKRITMIEDAVRWWMDEADASGKLHYYEMMRLAKRQDIEGGEFLIVKTYSKIPNQYIPYQLQMYEADWLSSAHDAYRTGGIDILAQPGETETRQGIEYYKLTGRVKGYWFRDPNYGGTDLYVPAENVVHGFETLRPQQVRGVSPFASGILIANDLQSYLDAEIDGAKMAAKWLAMIETPDPAMRQMPLPSQAGANGDPQKIEELENAIIEYMRPGEKVNLVSSNRPGATFQPFVRLILTMLSISTGAPFELISGDYNGLNYSTARIVRNDFSQQLRPICVRHIQQFAVPTVTTAIDMSVMSGKLTLPGYWQNPRRYYESEWQPPGMEAVDPLRESKAQIESIAMGLKSPQEVCRERGKDLEDIYKEILAAKDLAKEMGLSFEPADMALKNNPAFINNEGPNPAAAPAATPAATPAAI
jgi:lambda family phage portal protein